MLACNACLEPNRPVLSACYPRAEHLFRKMNGGSQASLVSASDSNFYVVKSAEGPQGPNVVLNEALGSMLSEHLGLPTPLWRPIRVDRKFQAENPGFRFETERGTRAPASGLYFGSRFIFPPTDGEVYETVPHGWVDRINNPALFIRMLLLDLWAENSDCRQALLVESPPRRTLDVVFFDHGHMFGGPYGHEAQRTAETCLYRHRKIYQIPLGSSEMVKWMMRRIETISETQLRGMLAGLPPEWRDDKIENGAIDLLLRNQRNLHERAHGLLRKMLN